MDFNGSVFSFKFFSNQRIFEGIVLKTYLILVQLFLENVYQKQSLITNNRTILKINYNSHILTTEDFILFKNKTIFDYIYSHFFV